MSIDELNKKFPETLCNFTLDSYLVLCYTNSVERARAYEHKEDTTMTVDRMLTEDEIFDKAIEELFRLLTYCFDCPEAIERYRKQAFGVIQFAMILAPSWEENLREQWDNWQKSVDNLAQMCYNK